MKAFVVYPKDKPREAVLVYVRDVNYQAARSWAIACHWSWFPQDNLVTERQPRWDTEKPPKRFCIMDEDLKDGLPPFGELRVTVKEEVPAKERAWKVYHDECKEETLLVYSSNQFAACESVIGQEPYGWGQADLRLLRAYRAPDWDHEAPPVAVSWDNQTIHRDLPDFFSNIESDGVAEHYVRTGREGQE